MTIILKMMASIAAVMAVATMVHAAKPAVSDDNVPPTCVAFLCADASDCARRSCPATCAKLTGETLGHCQN